MHTQIDPAILSNIFEVIEMCLLFGMYKSCYLADVSKLFPLLALMFSDGPFSATMCKFFPNGTIKSYFDKKNCQHVQVFS